MKTLVSPSLLSANFLDLRSEVEMINQSEADWLHMDIMDGVFVPNISFGFPVLEAVAKVCKKPLDVHFMIAHPEEYIEQTAKTGAMMMNDWILQDGEYHLTVLGVVRRRDGKFLITRRVMTKAWACWYFCWP